MFVMYSEDEHWCRLNESSFLSCTVTLMTIGTDGVIVHVCQVQ